MSKKHKKNCIVLNYTDHTPIAISKIPGCVSISAFACFVGIPTGISIFTIRLKIFVTTARMKLILKKKRKKHDKIVLLTNQN